MPFSGAGTGTLADPFLITTYTQFKAMNAAAVPSPVFTGTGLNDMLISTTGGYNAAGVNTYRFTIVDTGAIATKSSNVIGSGYAIGDTFTINGGTPGKLAIGTIFSLGSPMGFNLTYAGAGYTVANNIATTTLTGSGSGFTVNVLSTASDTYSWQKNGGALTTGPVDTAVVFIVDAIQVQFGALKGHTMADRWDITTLADPYFKLANDIDAAGGLGFNCTNYTGHLDGNAKKVQNLTLGYTSQFGFTLKSGSSVKDITFLVTGVVNNSEAGKERSIFGGNSDNGSISSVSLTNIKIITSGAGQLDLFSFFDFAATCTLKDIVMEGDIQGTFRGSVQGVIEGFKVLRTTNPKNAAHPAPPNYLVNNLYGEMKYCQHVILNFALTNGNVALLVANLNGTAKITESFVQGDYVCNYTTLAALVSHGLVLNVGATTAQVNDCYYKGNFSVNGGEQTSGNTLGKSGFIINPYTGLTVNRCIADVNLVSPLNNNRAVFARDASIKISNCFYKRSSITAITPVDVATRQTGLSDADYLDSTKFTGFNFTTVWSMGSAGPELRNNPFYSFATSIVLVTVASAVRASATTFTVALTTKYTSNFGFEVWENGVLIDTKTNQLSATVTSPLVDKLYVIKPFYIDSGSVKVYTTAVNYQHYTMAAALVAPTVITPAAPGLVILDTPIPADLIHGSTLYNGYIYGVSRQKPFPTHHGTLTKAPEHNIAAYVNIPIKTSERADNLYTSDQYSAGMEQVVVCGGYLYFLFNSNYPTGSAYLAQYDPVVNDYKVFRIAIARTEEPLVTDGTYLYICSYTTRRISKVLASQFVGAFPKYNVDTNFPVVVESIYDDTTQGGHILGGYSAALKGAIHSGVVDADFLYVSYTTDSGVGPVQGYSEALGISVCEAHKIRKSDMTAAGWVKIPKSTDDMAQNQTHLFYGIEVTAVANPLAYGYGWGAYAVRKSDMRLTGLPRLHSLDTRPGTTSYASLIFGNYLMDVKTNLTTYILNVSDVDNWSVTEPIASRTLAAFTYVQTPIPATPANEILLATDGNFYGFFFAGPSYIMQMQLTGFNFFTVPQVTTVSAIENAGSYVLSGYINSVNGDVDATITSKGFRYGTSAGALTSTITSAQTTPDFNAVLSGLPPGTYYYKAYAINPQGESTAEIKSFTVASSIRFYVADQPVLKIYKGTALVTVPESTS